MNGKQAKRLRRKARDRGVCALRYQNRQAGETVRLDAQCDRAIYQTLKRFHKRTQKACGQLEAERSRSNQGRRVRPHRSGGGDSGVKTFSDYSPEQMRQAIEAMKLGGTPKQRV